MCFIKVVLLFLSASYVAGGNANTKSYTEEFELTFFNNSIYIFLENNENGRLFYGELQRVLQEKELQFSELNNKFIHITDSERENNDFVTANMSLLQHSLENDLKSIFNDGAVRKRSGRRILQKIRKIILEIISRFFTTTTTTTTVSSVTSETTSAKGNSSRQ